MNVLKPVKHIISEDPDTKLIKVERPGFPLNREWKYVTNHDRQVHLTIWISKGYFYTWDYQLSEWAKINEEMKNSPVFVGRGRDDTNGEVYYFYGYEGRFYVSEIEVELAHVLVLINKEQKTKKERLQKEIDRIKAMVEGSVRVPIADDVQIFVWNRDGGKCVKCGSQELLEFDHIIPLSRGGSNSVRNIQLLCQNCNRTKQNKIGG